MIRKAVVAAAGAATRMWPTTKAVPKELLPLGDAPAILHLLVELLDAGITETTLVVGDNPEPLQRFFNPEILPPAKVADLPGVVALQRVIAEMKIRFIPQEGPYGNGTPLVNGLRYVGDEACIYAFSDDIVLGENATKGLIGLWAEYGCPVAVAQEVPKERAKMFGIIECAPGTPVVTRLFEKPTPEQTSSTLASFGRYIVTPDLAEHLSKVGVGRGGEVWFTDALVRQLDAGGRVCAYTLREGRWYTVGDPVGYAQAFGSAIGKPIGR